MARPNWEDEKTYPSIPDEWAWRVWAWEFLRRNEAFQQACDASMNASTLVKQQMARTWGLTEFKPFRENYEGAHQCLWLSESFCEYEAGIIGGKEYRVTLNQHEVALVFDLKHVEIVGLSAIEALVSATRDVLTEYMKDFELKKPDFRVSRRGLFETLRVYDAITFAKAKPTDVARVLRPTPFEANKLNESKDVTGQGEARKYVSDLFERGRDLVENRGYLKLATRDHIADRSKVKKRASAGKRVAADN